MKVNVLLLNSIIISLISGCTFFPDVEVDDISHIESEIYNPAYTECMDDDMTKTQIFNNKNNFLVRETTDGFFLCGPIDDKLGIYYKDNNADIWKLCCEGTCILGPIFDNYLYFLSADFENNKMLYSDLLDMSDVRYIYDTVKAMDMDMMFELQADGVIYSERRCIEDTKRYNSYHIDEFIKKTRVPVENIGEYIASRDKPVAKVNIFFPTAEIRDEVVEKIKDINYDLSYSEGTNLEFNVKGTTKAKGLVALAEYLGISIEETMAIGDNLNDVDILKNAGVSVVMDNARDEIKKLGDFITLSNDENGVAYAIKELINSNN